MSGEICGALRRARLALIEAGDLLRSPRPARLERCEAALGLAVRELTACKAALGDGGNRPDALACPETLAEARGLKTALERASRLLDSAADHHRRWSRVLGALVGGYTAQGEAAAVTPPSRTILRG
jgi:hypothetical protein